MLETFARWPSILQALAATLFTWFVTAFGAGMVYIFRTAKRTILDAMMGFAGGIMMAASFWSLLAPAINIAVDLHMRAWMTVVCGFLSGGIVLCLLEKCNMRLLSESRRNRSTLLVLSITLHNIPEGLAIGVAFGSLGRGMDGASLMGACMLALGIGLQNFPEGAAVSLPLVREGYGRKKAFWWGQLSGMVEPIAGVLGALMVIQAQYMLPWMLAFAAGAMIYVVVEELIPESQAGAHKQLSVISTLIGFATMMALDVALG